MKKVNCDLFGHGEYIMFNMQRLMEFEAAVGKPVSELLTMVQWPINCIISGYAIGMKQYGRNPNKYMELIGELLEDEEQNLTLAAIQLPITKALIASGVFGAQLYYQMFPDEMTDADKLAIESENNPKN